MTAATPATADDERASNDSRQSRATRDGADTAIEPQPVDEVKGNDVLDESDNEEEEQEGFEE